MDEKKYQNMIIILDDDREICVTVPAFCTEEEVVNQTIGIKEIRLSVPADLPPEHVWGVIEK